MRVACGDRRGTGEPQPGLVQLQLQALRVTRWKDRRERARRRVALLTHHPLPGARPACAERNIPTNPINAGYLLRTRSRRYRKRKYETKRKCFLDSWILVRSQILKMPLLFANEYCSASCPFRPRRSRSNYSSTASC